LSKIHVEQRSKTVSEVFISFHRSLFRCLSNILQYFLGLRSRLPSERNRCISWESQFSLSSFFVILAWRNSKTHVLGGIHPRFSIFRLLVRFRGRLLPLINCGRRECGNCIRHCNARPGCTVIVLDVCATLGM